MLLRKTLVRSEIDGDNTVIMQTLARTKKPRINQRFRLLYLAICLIGLYVIVPQVSSFHRSINLIIHIHFYYVITIIGFTALTYFAAAATYYILSFTILIYRRTLMVELASMFVNRLLPAGIGGIGANYTYLRNQGHTKLQAAAVVAINNLLGLLGHALLVIALLVYHPSSLQLLHLPSISHTTILFIIIALLIVALITLFFPTTHRKLLNLLQRFILQSKQYRHKKSKLFLALLCSMALTLGNVLAFEVSTHAVGGHLSITPILLIFTFGIALGTVTPTPGGLGGIEAGLVAGLVAYHATTSQALAGVLVYRLVSYWIALIVGALAFAVADRRHYLV